MDTWPEDVQSVQHGKGSLGSKRKSACKKRRTSLSLNRYTSTEDDPHMGQIHFPTNASWQQHSKQQGWSKD
jgi:hypothetical protein